MRNRKKDFTKFSKRASVKERGKRRLLAIVNEMNVGTEGARINVGAARERGAHVAEGIFSESAQGYGFVSVPGMERDVFIPEGRIGGAVGGDLVRISYRYVEGREGDARTEGRITEVLEENARLITGTVECDVVRMHKRRCYRPFLIPDSPRIKRRIEIRDDGGANEGDKVQARLVRDELYSYLLSCDVTAVFGPADTREANYLAVLAECEIDTEFTEEELAAAEAAAAEPISHEGRHVRDEVIFTIDSESAKDLDDAISLEKTDEGYLLGVHIADVSHYVREKTVLDRLVTSRGTSVYFTDKVVPMLPPVLSNSACSLNPGEEKYTLSAMIRLSEDGAILDLSLERSVIVSRVKGIYSEINRIFDGTANDILLEKYRDCLPSLELMHTLYLKLAERSRKRGALELEGEEAEILLDQNGHPTDIIKRTRGDAERLIEQFMLTANEAVATYMKERAIPCVYRVHEPPDPEKLEEFINYAHNLGFGTDVISRNKCDSHALADLIRNASERGMGEAISYACLRSMSKACYSDVGHGHFGLGIENYCHFTSPIRRLSDLVTHRIIHRVLFDNKPAEKYRSQAKRAAAAATDGECRADAAERRIDQLYKAIYMQSHLGEEFCGKISSITSFGCFVTLENTCEGLVPISALEGYIYDEGNVTLRCGTKVLHIADTVKITVAECDVSRGKLLFMPAEVWCET